MKTETVVTTCDMCGKVDAEELRYAIMGREYALDLCSEDREHFDTYMAVYLLKSRKVTYRNHTVRKDRARPVIVAQDRPADEPKRKPGRPRKMQTSPDGAVS